MIATARSTITDILTALPAALDPGSRTRRAVRTLRLGGVVRLAAIGKAAVPMAAAAVAEIGGSIVGGVVVAPEPGVVSDLDTYVGSHPVPDDESVRAGRALLDQAARRDHDTLLVLISGGGSSLAEVPKPPLRIADVASITDRLMRVGTPIEELNVVRRHLSLLKHGGLSARTNAEVVTLVVSDVGDGPPSMVASGPTLQDSSTSLDALQVLERRLGRPVPHGVRSALARSVPRRPNGEVIVVADRLTAYAEAVHRLESTALGHAAPVRLTGPATAMADRMLRSPGLVVGTGETVVEVRGDGRGGRNQHAALSAALQIAGTTAVFGAIGTDGVDGPTDAAGAVVDGRTAARIREAGVDPVSSLARCDSHPALDAADCLIRTGPTGTNVADVWISYTPHTT